jgi:uncharacterized protein (DUF305 family)
MRRIGMRTEEMSVRVGKALWATVVAGVVVVGGIGFATATMGAHAKTASDAAMPGMTHGGTSTAATGTARYGAGLSDKAFITMMIPHHESAIEMANLAIKRAGHKEVRTLAQGIVAAQNAEITQLRGWYRKWFGGEVPVTTMSAAGMAGIGMSGDMAALQAAKPFDRAFLSMMIPHHAGAVVMANRVLASKRPEIRMLGAQIIAAQAKEIGQMQALRDTWYPPLG